MGEVETEEGKKGFNRKTALIGSGTAALAAATGALVGTLLLRNKKDQDELDKIASRGREVLGRENEALANSIGEIWGIHLGEAIMTPAETAFCLRRIWGACLILAPGIGEGIANMRGNTQNTSGPIVATWEGLGEKDLVYLLKTPATCLNSKGEASGNGRFIVDISGWSQPVGGIFLHEMVHELTLVTSLPLLRVRFGGLSTHRSQVENWRGNGLSQFVADTASIQGDILRLRFPELVSWYAAYNSGEKEAETGTHFLLAPGDALRRLRSTDLAVRYEAYAMVKFFEHVSGGMMDIDYFRDSADGRVTGLEYWEKKEPTRGFIVERGKEIMMAVDLNMGTSKGEYLPGLVKITSGRAGTGNFPATTDDFKRVMRRSVEGGKVMTPAEPFAGKAEWPADANIAGLDIRVFGGTTVCLMVGDYPTAIVAFDNDNLDEMREVTLYAQGEAVTILLTAKNSRADGQGYIYPSYKVVSHRRLEGGGLDDGEFSADVVGSKDYKLLQLIARAGGVVAGGVGVAALAREYFRKKEAERAAQERVSTGERNKQGGLSRRRFLGLGAAAVGVTAVALDLSQRPAEPFIDPLDMGQMAKNMRAIMEKKLAFPVPFDILPWSDGNREEKIRVLFQ